MGSKYKIGQILTSECDVKVEKFTGEEVTIPKGSKVIIGADGFAHHIRNGMLQPLSDDDEISEYDAKGIAEYLSTVLCYEMPLDDMLQNYDFNKEDLIDAIEYALSEIGF